LASKTWHLIPIDLFGGFLWSGYSLASFNLLLSLTPEDRRSRYTAVYQIAVMLALAGGSALGGIIAVKWGFVSLFVLAGTVRFGAALLFARYVRQTNDETETSRSYLRTLRRKPRTI
jgi:predicted MFS family arabinose efflux permease